MMIVKAHKENSHVGKTQQKSRQCKILDFTWSSAVVKKRITACFYYQKVIKLIKMQKVRVASSTSHAE